MTAQEVQGHLNDLKEQLKLMLFHEQTLMRKLELLKPKIESNIAIPRQIGNIGNLSKNDLEIDVVPANLADMHTITAREEYYYAVTGLADVRANIEATKVLYNTYKDHMQASFNEQAKPCTDEMIYDAYQKASALKDLSPDESSAMKNISDNLMKLLNSGKEKRLELLQTLQNLIKQHS